MENIKKFILFWNLKLNCKIASFFLKLIKFSKTEIEKVLQDIKKKNEPEPESPNFKDVWVTYKGV